MSRPATSASTRSPSSVSPRAAAAAAARGGKKAVSFSPPEPFVKRCVPLRPVPTGAAIRDAARSGEAMAICEALVREVTALAGDRIAATYFDSAAAVYTAHAVWEEVMGALGVAFLTHDAPPAPRDINAPPRTGPSAGQHSLPNKAAAPTAAPASKHAPPSRIPMDNTHDDVPDQCLALNRAIYVHTATTHRKTAASTAAARAASSASRTLSPLPDPASPRVPRAHSISANRYALVDATIPDIPPAPEQRATSPGGGEELVTRDVADPAAVRSRAVSLQSTSSLSSKTAGSPTTRRRVLTLTPAEELERQQQAKRSPDNNSFDKQRPSVLGGISLPPALAGVQALSASVMPDYSLDHPPTTVRGKWRADKAPARIICDEVSRNVAIIKNKKPAAVVIGATGGVVRRARAATRIGGGTGFTNASSVASLNITAITSASLAAASGSPRMASLGTLPSTAAPSPSNTAMLDPRRSVTQATDGPRGPSPAPMLGTRSGSSETQMASASPSTRRPDSAQPRPPSRPTSSRAKAPPVPGDGTPPRPQGRGRETAKERAARIKAEEEERVAEAQRAEREEEASLPPDVDLDGFRILREQRKRQAAAREAHAASATAVAKALSNPAVASRPFIVDGSKGLVLTVQSVPESGGPAPTQRSSPRRPLQPASPAPTTHSVFLSSPARAEVADTSAVSSQPSSIDGPAGNGVVIRHASPGFHVRAGTRRESGDATAAAGPTPKTSARRPAQTPNSAPAGRRRPRGAAAREALFMAPESIVHMAIDVVPVGGVTCLELTPRPQTAADGRDGAGAPAHHPHPPTAATARGGRDMRFPAGMMTREQFEQSIHTQRAGAVPTTTAAVPATSAPQTPTPARAGPSTPRPGSTARQATESSTAGRSGGSALLSSATAMAQLRAAAHDNKGGAKGPDHARTAPSTPSTVPRPPKAAPVPSTPTGAAAAAAASSGARLGALLAAQAGSPAQQGGTGSSGARRTTTVRLITNDEAMRVLEDDL